MVSVGGFVASASCVMDMDVVEGLVCTLRWFYNRGVFL